MNGIYEVREYINGGTDWYSHWFKNGQIARQWIEENEPWLHQGADIVYHRFAMDVDLEPVYILDPK